MRTWESYQKTIEQKENLHDAARRGDVQQLSKLLEQGQSIEMLDVKGYSPLMLAAYHGHAEAVTLLIKCGANVNAMDFAGNSILMGVAFKGHLTVAKQLLEAGADAGYCNPAGQNALQFAQMFGRFEVVQLLSAPASILSHSLQLISAWARFFRPRNSERN